MAGDIQIEELANEISKQLNRYSKLSHEVIIIAEVSEGKIKDYFLVAKGNSDRVSISLLYLLKFLKQKNVKKFVLIHNHPSGDALPSKQDMVFLEDLMSYVENEEIVLLDSIILSCNGFCSLKLCSLKKQLFVVSNKN